MYAGGSDIGFLPFCQRLANGVLEVEYLDDFFNEEKQKEYDEGIKGLIW